MSIKYQAHVDGHGWLPEVENGIIAGSVGEARSLQAIRITDLELPNTNIDAYCHVATIGDSGVRDESGNIIEGNHLGEDIGTTGLGLAAEAFRIGLIGDGANTADIYYRVHTADIGWMEWAKNGEWAGTKGGGKQVEAIQIMLMPKNQPFYLGVDNNNNFIDLTPPPAAVTGESEDVKRAKVVSEAQAAIGYHEVGGKSRYGERYGDPYGQWCAYFVRAQFSDAGYPELAPPTGYCPTAVDWLLRHNKAYFYKRGQYVPRNGDIIYFDYNRNGVPDHTGIVEGCDGKTVCTIEGNKGDAVKRQYYPVNSLDIYGYGVPAY